MPNKITLPAPAQLHQWQQSFAALNQARLDAAYSLMLPKQQQVLDLIPVLLHMNHVRLPGFVANQVPAGVAHFEPSARQLNAVQTLARGLSVPRGRGQPPIEGLYLIGSSGSVAQSRSSDLDVWLCYQEALSATELALLTKKCRLIEEWAADLSVELHFFLMHLTDFRSGKKHFAEGEDSGSTQHLLLLDEFYRSAIWLAGARPRWWLIPSDMEQNADLYWQALVNEHRVEEHKWLHFGNIPSIPAAEYVGAGLWQLHKGLHSPYKSILKLLLTCNYASQYPHSRPLCWDLKKQIHQGNIDRDQNDAYWLLLDRISTQLDQDSERLALMRRAFYYKLKLPLSQATPSQKSSWRFQVIQRIVAAWGWDDFTVKLMDDRQSWDPIRIATERNALINEMLLSYRFLVGFSQKYVGKLHISKQDLQALGNRLYAAFDSRPGKIININPGISPSLFQETITFEIKEGVWRLLPGFWPQDSGTTHAVLKQSPSLIELLCFARLNAIWQENTRIFIAQSQAISAYELKQIQQAVKEIQTIQVNSKSFLHPAKPISWRIFVNVGVDPQKHLSRKGMQKISSRDDALGFSAIRENLVLTIDLVTINSWGEWQVDRFQGDDSLAKLLFTLLQSQSLAKEQGWPESQVYCYCDSRAAAIAKRVEEVVRDVQEHFIQTPKTPYLLEIATSYYLFEQGEKSIELKTADNSQKLLALLQRKFRSYTTYRLDKTALLGSPLRLIYEKSAAGLWQIFFWRKDERLYFYFLDEKGALLHLQWQEEVGKNSVLYWLMPLLRFLKQLDQRFSQKEQRTRERRLVLYELKRQANSYEFDLLRRQIPEGIEPPASIDVRAMLNREQQATIYINGQEFSAWQYGDDFYRVITETVRALRQSHGHYPLFLSDLELPDNDSVIDHLQVRYKLESRLAQIS